MKCTLKDRFNKWNKLVSVCVSEWKSLFLWVSEWVSGWMSYLLWVSEGMSSILWVNEWVIYWVIYCEWVSDGMSEFLTSLYVNLRLIGKQRFIPYVIMFYQLFRYKSSMEVLPIKHTVKISHFYLAFIWFFFINRRMKVTSVIVSTLVFKVIQ